MKLKAVVKDESAKKHEENVKRGRRSKNKGASYERTIASKFKAFYDTELVRTPQSGGFAKKSAKAGEFRGDVVPVEDDIELTIHIECKNTKNWNLPAWLRQSERDCVKGKIPVVVFHKFGTSKDYITLSLDDFFKLVPKSAVVKKVIKK